MKKQIFAMMLSAAVLCGTAAAGWTAEADLRPDIDVVIDGAERTFYNASGAEVHPISYQDTTYLPVRAIGELMGKNVNWDAATQTISIGGTRVTGTTSGTADRNARAQDISLTVRPEYTVVIDGVTRTFYDAKGREVQPVEYQGSVYLPVRAIGELMGKTVDWDENTQTVKLSGGSTVTDYDTANPTTPTQQGTASGAITAERARQIALEHAGLSASGVQFLRTQTDRDDGRLVYEVEFVTKNGNVWKEYDYEIDANTGRIIDIDYDAETAYNTGTGTAGSSTASTTLEAAKQTALQHAGLTASQVQFLKTETDRDDGRLIYEIEFVTRSGNVWKEYDYEIDANTGRIIDMDYDAETAYDDRYDDDWDDRYDDWDDRYDDDWDDRYDDDWDDRYDDDWDDRYDDDWDDRYDD